LISAFLASSQSWIGQWQVHATTNERTYWLIPFVQCLKHFILEEM
jgi:hypothetical protein